MINPILFGSSVIGSADAALSCSANRCDGWGSRWSGDTNSAEVWCVQANNVAATSQMPLLR